MLSSLTAAVAHLVRARDRSRLSLRVASRDFGTSCFKGSWALPAPIVLPAKSIAHLNTAGDCALRDFRPAYDRSGSTSVIVAMHPDVAKLKFKFKRWHHAVDHTFISLHRLGSSHCCLFSQPSILARATAIALSRGPSTGTFVGVLRG
jgi:hypothetical protein